MLELGFKIFLSYLLGSINGALIIGRVRGVDIRKHGSGNAGGTNALRTQGKSFAIAVMIIDILKGVVPIFLFPALLIPGIALDPLISREWLVFSCGISAVVGHCYPIWFNFEGGKGAATVLGVVAAVSPILLVPGLITWVLLLKLFGFVGLATIAAGLAMPAFVLITSWPENEPLFLFSLALGIFVLFTHRSNIYKFRSRESRVDVKPWIDTGRS
jgi:acyl phosphate:glycerol-3-phosphate acyltransferase